MNGPLRICVGYDSREPLALEVLAHSIIARASAPVSIIPIAQSHLQHIYTRPRGATEATEFSLTRFLAPYLCGYQGLGIFMDCDMLCQADIYEVLDVVEAQPGKAVWVCQHDYTPQAGGKFLGQANTAYPRKNWSSFMVFDADRCLALTPAYVNTATGLELHRFHWLTDDAIGSLPLEWNWLVGEYTKLPNAKVLHYTLGTPCFRDYRDCDHADLWFAELDAMNRPLSHWIQGEREPLASTLNVR